MLKRLIAPALVLACTALATAQTQTTQPDRKSKTPPSNVQPAKKTPANKRTASLKVGSKAPALKGDSWVKGSPVESFAPGQVYVVEFWATWCGPCIKGIPHLTELQQRNKGLTVIGVAASEQQETKGDDRRLDNLERFVRAKGDQMGYSVLYSADGAMYKTWMNAAGEGGIPCAFVVGGDGKIAWIGNPHDKSFDSQVAKTIKAASKMTPPKDPGTKKDPAPADPKKPADPTAPTNKAPTSKTPAKKEPTRK